MKKHIPILLGTALAVIVLGGYAFAKSLPSDNERIVNFNLQLIEEKKEQWAELDETHTMYNEWVADIIVQKNKLHEEVEMLRMTNEVMADFIQPVN